jgi:thiamine kinase-like enzyme
VDDLDDALRQLEAWLGPRDGDPEPLEGGITNRNYRLTLGGGDCVLRLAGKDTALLGIDRQAERAANEVAARLRIAPPVLAIGDGWLATEYLAGRPADAAGIRAAPEPIAEALRRFHDSGLELPNRFWVPELLDTYANRVRERGGRVPPEYERAQVLAQRIGELVPLTEPVPCHNDLLPANVLRVGPHDAVMLVDWEYAGMGHGMFDLANLAANAELEEAEETRLLAAYLGRAPEPSELAKLRLMRIMSDAREAAWGVAQTVLSELDFDFEAYAARHFERLAAAAHDPRLREWLGAAAA